MEIRGQNAAQWQAVFRPVIPQTFNSSLFDQARQGFRLTSARQTDLTPAAPRYLLRLNHRILKYPAHYDPILTSYFASPFRFVRSSLLRRTATARQPAGSGGEKNRVPRGQPALGGKTACRFDRCRGGLFAPEQERPRALRRPGALREALAHGRQRGHQN